MAKRYVYDEAANGLMVRIPLDQYDQWKEAQDRLRRGERSASEETRRMAQRLKSDTENG